MISALRTTALTFTLGSALFAQNADGMTHFTYEVLGGWTNTVSDTSPEIELDTYSLLGTIHLKPVALANNPWNEAAFLERSTFVQAGFDYADLSFGSVSSDGAVFQAGGRYAEKDVPVAADLEIQTGSLSGDADVDIDSYSGRVGYWAMPTAIVGGKISFDRLQLGTLSDIESTTFGAFGKWVHDLGEGRALNLFAELDFVSVDDSTTTDENVELGLGADYYFTQKVSLGGQARISSGDAGTREGTTLGVRGSVWLTPQISANASFSHFTVDDDAAGSDQDVFSVFFLVRF